MTITPPTVVTTPDASGTTVPADTRYEVLTRASAAPAAPAADVFPPCAVCGLRGCTREHAGPLELDEDLTAKTIEDLEREALDLLAEMSRRHVENTRATVRLGRRVLQAKTLLGKGFGGWVKRRLGLSATQRTQYLKVARNAAFVLSLPPETGLRGQLRAIDEELKKTEPKAAAPQVVLPDVTLIEGIEIEVLDAADLPRAWHGTVDLVVTSPPYGIGEARNGYVDVLDWEEYQMRSLEWAGQMALAMAERGRVCLNVPLDVRKGVGPRPLYAWWVQALQAAGLRYETTVFWTKAANGQLTRATARGSMGSPNAPCVLAPAEMIAVFHAPGPWTLGDPKVRGDFTREEQLLWSNGWWEFSGQRRTRLNPCPYPEELAERCIRLYARPGGVVGDFFLGDGTTAVAAARWGRRFVGGDVVPAFVQQARAWAASVARQPGREP